MLNFLRPLLILMALVTAGMPVAQARMSYDLQGSGRLQVPSGKSGKLLRFGPIAVSGPAASSPNLLASTSDLRNPPWYPAPGFLSGPVSYSIAAGNTAQFFVYQEVNVTAGQTYTWGFSTKRTAGSGPGQLRASFYKNGDANSTIAAPQTVTDGVQYRSAITITPNYSATIRVYIEVPPGTDNGQAGRIYNAWFGTGAVDGWSPSDPEYVDSAIPAAPAAYVPPAVSAPVANALAIGTYVENRSDAGQDFVSWLGTTPSNFFVESHGPGQTATGSDALSGASGGWGYTLGANGWLGSGKQQNTQVPMLPKDGSVTLAQSAGGSLDAVYYSAALSIIDYLAANNPTQTKTIIRPGQEMNANYAGGGTNVLPSWSWQIVRNGAVDATIAGQFGTTFQRFVTQFRAAAAARSKPNFFEFTFSVNLGGFDWSAAWPGDAYVDYMGMDGYFGGDGYGVQPVRYDGYDIWEHMRAMPWGFQAAKDFAVAHGKPFRVDEFGVSGKDLQFLVKAALDWCQSNAVAFGWWDSDGAYASRISNGNLATTASAIRNKFNPNGFPDLVPVTLGPNLIAQPVPNLAAGWSSNGQDLVITPNYGLAPDGTTPTTRIRSASGSANLEYALQHAAGRQSLNARALIAQKLSHFSSETGEQIHILKAGDVHQVVQSISPNLQATIYSSNGPFDFEVWGFTVSSP